MPDDLRFTGERYLPELLGEIRQEHVHRYAWCLDLVKGLDVVDIASGEGFGAAMLARQARSVVGIDVAAEAVDHANRRYPRDNLRFICADAVSTPLDSQCADIVVSFETIEHVTDQPAMLAEIRRLLRPSGLLIMSSPNVEVYSVRQGHQNRFHTRELSRDEFERLLGEQFGATRILGQRLAVASTIFGQESGVSATVMRDSGTVTATSAELPPVMYFIAVAAATPELLPPISSSVLFSDIYDVYWGMRDQLDSTRAQVVALRGRVLGDLAIEGGWFDEAYYRVAAGLPDMQLDELIKHYLSQGEAAGLAPSANFDPHFYRVANSDVSQAQMGLLRHFLLFGADEGRLPKDPNAAALPPAAQPVSNDQLARETTAAGAEEAPPTLPDLSGDRSH